MLEGLNVLWALIGIGLAYKLYAHRAHAPTQSKLFTRWAVNKFYIDELYDKLIVNPIVLLSGFTAHVMEPKIFDGIIKLNVRLYRGAANMFSELQNGRVRYYALYMLFGISVLSVYLIVKLGV